jgi:hypothetical protein
MYVFMYVFTLEMKLAHDPEGLIREPVGGEKRGPGG